MNWSSKRATVSFEELDQIRAMRQTYSCGRFTHPLDLLIFNSPLRSVVLRRPRGPTATALPVSYWLESRQTRQCSAPLCCRASESNQFFDKAVTRDYSRAVPGNR